MRAKGVLPSTIASPNRVRHTPRPCIGIRRVRVHWSRLWDDVRRNGDLLEFRIVQAVRIVIHELGDFRGDLDGLGVGGGPGR